MNSIAKQASELNESIELLNLELKRNQAMSKDDPEYVGDENLEKVKSAISNLELYNFQNYTLRDEINNFYNKSKTLTVNESIVLGLIKSIIKYEKNENNNKKILTFNDLVDSSKSIINKEDFDVNKNIFNEAEKAVNYILNRHKYYNKPNDEQTKYNSDMDKCMDNLNNMKSNIEFLFIKAIIIGIINYIQEFMNNIYKDFVKNNYDTDKKDNNEKSKEIKLNPEIYCKIFVEYAYLKDNSFCLEKNFLDYLNDFKKAHNISFTMQDLFGDIFWNIIFHDKIICENFVVYYMEKENFKEEIKDMLKYICNAMLGLKNPVKDQIFNLLSLKHIEQHKINLISSIPNQQVLNHDLIHNEIMKHLNGHCLHCKKHMNNKNSKKKEIIESNIDYDNSLDNKTVEEIYNYINDDSDNKKKKKRRNKKKKKKKNDDDAIENNKNEVIIETEDSVVNEFKQFIIDNIINANEINKIKPVISENFLNIISQKY